MNTRPKVSVVMPMYNQEKYIKECLLSVMHQTLKDIEIIVVNDGSTDNSLEIVKKYANKDGRIKIIDKPNSGYGHSMNMGMAQAVGEYIGIVETDDFVKPNMFEELYKVCKENNLEFVKSGFLRFAGECSERSYEKVKLSNDVNAYNRVIDPRNEPICATYTMNIWTGIYSKKFLDSNDIKFNETPGASFQDNGFHFLSFFFAKKIMLLDKEYYCVRRDNPNSSVKDKGKAYVICEEYKYIYDIISKNKNFSIFSGAFYYRMFISYYFNYTRIDEALRLDFAKKYSDEMKYAKENGLIDLSYFDAKRLEELNQIIDNPKVFFDTHKEVSKISVSPKRTATKSRKSNISVSVIIPIYNMEKFLPESLDTVLSQSLKNIEIICVNDGSTDGSLNILKKYKKQDKRVIIIDQENQGVGKSRNTGIMRATGKFVIFMDPDDYYPSNNVLETLYKKAVKKNALICGGSFSEIKDGVVKDVYEGKFKSYTFIHEGFVAYKDYQFDYGYQRFIFERDMLVNNNIFFPDYCRFQDPPFFVSAMIRADKFYAIPKVVYRYRWGHQNIDWNAKRITALLNGINDLLRYSRDNGLEVLHYNTVQKIDKEFSDRILAVIKPGNFGIINILRKLNYLIDANLLNKANQSIKPRYISKTYDRALDKLMEYVLKAPALKTGAMVSFSSKDAEINVLQKEIIRLQKRLLDASEAFIAQSHSFSYRFGRMVTWLPRKVRDLFRKK